MFEFILFYFGVGYVINNALALYALYSAYDEVEIDLPNFIVTIPAWPYTLYSVIASVFSKEE